MKRLLVLLLSLTVCGCCLSASIGFSSQYAYQGIVDYDDYGQRIPGGAPAPGRGDCANINEVIPGNPFSGWPLAHAVDWSMISSWWCDPNYTAEYGVIHWGIDIARSVRDRRSIEGVPAVCTAEDARVIAADFTGWPATRSNSGMGNFVKLMALQCQWVCDEFDLVTGECLERRKECVDTGFVATYMHLKFVSVEVDQLITRGQVIGGVDSTGNSSGNHLHYQINAPGFGAIDPAPTMPGYQPDMRGMPRQDR